MSGTLTILTAGPSLSIQDLGRPGYRALGLTRSGAADPTALYEGAALLGSDPRNAALEMVGMGGSFRVDQDTRIALTGAAMSAKIDDTPLVWNASHLLPAGATLTIGGTLSGSYGYLHVGGGFDTEELMGSRAFHLRVDIGKEIRAGDSFPMGKDTAGRVGLALPNDPRFEGGTLRVVPSMQTGQFSAETRQRFGETLFRRDPRANRMGARMDSDGEGFFAQDQLNIVSEVIVPGDVQITGDGAPFVLLCECQTTGGYPRIGTVIPCDLPRVAQAQAGTALRFQFVSVENALTAERAALAERKKLASRLYPLVRNPHDIRDLLAYQLVGGVISAMADPFVTET